MNTTQKNQLRWLWLSAFIILLDQVSKWFISQSLTYHEAKTILPFFNLILSHNTGAAWGFLSMGGNWARWLFVSVATFISIFIIYMLAVKPRPSNTSACAMALVLGGALGNLWDRIQFGYVRDFLDFHLNNWHFATFNIADSAITIGIIMWILINLKGK